MKVGVFTVILQSMPFEQALDYLVGLGVQTVEIGAGAFSGTAHCEPTPLLASDRAVREFLHAIQSRGLEISCLSVHDNPLHPNWEIAKQHQAAFERCIRLANRLEVEVVTTFSGCPGGADGDQRPNWVTCPWPPDFLEILDYQWNEVAIPYWQEAVQLARRHGIKKIALEMHPGFVVYNPETLLRLRAAAGREIGANFDPSHLIWQGTDPAAAVRALQDAIWHVHAKDTARVCSTPSLKLFEAELLRHFFRPDATTSRRSRSSRPRSDPRCKAGHLRRSQRKADEKNVPQTEFGGEFGG